MTLKSIESVTTADEAEEIAKEWQQWASEQALSYAEVADCQHYFVQLAAKFDLTEVFNENGII